MTATLSFTPLYGAKSGDPVCFVLKLGSVTILLDCGWDEQFNEVLLEPLIKVVPDIDLVLLSHPDTRHLGALPYLVGKAGLKAPIYATAPVVKLGQMFLYDHHGSLSAQSEFDTFTMEHVDKAFDAIKVLKHHQQLQLEVNGTLLHILGYPAGHMIGGTVWLIEAGGEAVVYAVDTNHSKERHLNGGQLALVPSRPALLVIDAARVRHKHRTRAKREAELKDTILSVLRRQGNVLLPVDTAGRMFELLLVLDKMWLTTDPKLPYTLALLSPVADSTVSYARNMLEWLSSEIQKEFNNNPQLNPVSIKSVVRLCHSVSDVGRLGTGPKVVLASGLSLGSGMARELLLQWGPDARNAVIFTQQPRPGTLAAQLPLKGPDAPPCAPITLSLTVGRRVKLEGAELEAYYADRAAKEAEAVAAAMEGGPAAGVMLPLRESSGVLSQLKRSNTGAVEQVLPEGSAFDDVFGEAGARSLEDKGVLLDGFKPPSTAMYSMFPDEQELLQQGWDAYGAVVDTTELRKTEEDLDADGIVGDEEDMEVEEIPTKVVRDQVSLTFAATAQLIDGFSGGSDGRSLRTIVAKLAPRALVLVGGTEEQTAEMAAACSRELPQQQTRVFTPGAGQTVSLSLAASYPIAISNALLQGLSKHTLTSGDIAYDVSWLDGQIGRKAAAAAGDAAAAAAGGGAAGAGSSNAAAKKENDKALQLVLQPPGAAAAVLDGLQQHPSSSSGLDAAGTAAANGAAAGQAAGGEAMEVDHDAAAEAAEGPGAAAAAMAAEYDSLVACGDHGGIFIGDVKLSEVKQALAAAGVPSEFRGGGRLVVGGSLTVRRDGPEGQLVMEGPLCDDYFKVRDVVYSQYNVC